MLPIESCKLDPVPDLRAGVLDPEQVRTISAGFVNWNPNTGAAPGLPGRMGFQSFKVRMQAQKLISKSALRIEESLNRDGQINPVLLWARWDRLWISYGGTRVMWAYFNDKPLKALIVDHDRKFTDWRLVPYEQIIQEFELPPVGVVPMKFGWAHGEDYVICDSREWQMMDASEWKKVQDAVPKKKRRRRTKAEMEYDRAVLSSIGRA